MFGCPIVTALLTWHSAFILTTDTDMTVHILYIDPGSGSYLVQVIAAAVVGVAFFFRNIKMYIRSLFTRSSKKPKDNLFQREAQLLEDECQNRTDQHAHDKSRRSRESRSRVAVQDIHSR